MTTLGPDQSQEVEFAQVYLLESEKHITNYGQTVKWIRLFNVKLQSKAFSLAKARLDRALFSALNVLQMVILTPSF